MLSQLTGLVGSKVEVPLEIRAELGDGASDRLTRDVTECTVQGCESTCKQYFLHQKVFLITERAQVDVPNAARHHKHPAAGADGFSDEADRWKRPTPS